MTNVELLKQKILQGQELSAAEVYSLLDAPRAALRDAAAELTRKLCPRQFDSCSIINARSGACSENCAWCAQSARFSTGCATYPVVEREHCLDIARQNRDAGVRRFSLVASGRAAHGEHLRQMADLCREVRRHTGLYVCASMGLLTREALQLLWDSGVRRYHCNLETAESYFGRLCTTHTIEDKLRTIETARSIGMEICSGGIIGMGETARQRAEFALTLRRARPDSIPINLLSPIAGTPLEGTPPLPDDDIIDTVAIFRFAHPRVILRFAGGRRRLSPQVQLELMRVGISGAIMGDLLTTIGSSVEADRRLIEEAGYSF